METSRVGEINLANEFFRSMPARVASEDIPGRRSLILGVHEMVFARFARILMAFCVVFIFGLVTHAAHAADTSSLRQISYPLGKSQICQSDSKQHAVGVTLRAIKSRTMHLAAACRQICVDNLNTCLKGCDGAAQCNAQCQRNYDGCCAS